MLKLLYILLLLCSCSVSAQTDFFGVYTKVKECRENGKIINEKMAKEIRELPKETAKDTAYVRRLIRRSRDSINSCLAKQLQRLINLPFPDINFCDKDSHFYSLSDFNGTDIVICYNYMYCDSCFYLIDTIIRQLRRKDIRVIALFSDKFQSGSTMEKVYNDNVLVAFINDDTKELISLTMGNSFIYYLDSNKQIRFFDRTYFTKRESAWINFLNH